MAGRHRDCIGILEATPGEVSAVVSGADLLTSRSMVLHRHHGLTTDAGQGSDQVWAVLASQHSLIVHKSETGDGSARQRFRHWAVAKDGIGRLRAQIDQEKHAGAISRRGRGQLRRC